MQHTDGVNHLVGIEPRVLVVRVAVTNPKGEGLRLALGEMKTAAAFKDEKSAVLLGLRAFAIGTFFQGGQEYRGASRAFGEGVVPFDKTARAANHEQAHIIEPVVSMFAFLEGGEAIDGTLMAASEFVRTTVTV